ncbi:MAG: hypothetical protein JO337_00710 [Acidimicrobiales bacterium]|nr:hypothetical protein [Acidimicrobiales bacterium]
MAFVYAPPTPGWVPWIRRHLVSVAPAALTLVIAAGGLLLGWTGVDQAAQTYRVVQFQLHGLMLWDSGWYAGNFPLGYSVLFPPVAAIFGLQVVAVASAVVATWSFDRVIRTYLGGRPLGTWYFAVSTLLPVTIGQWPFLAGEATGLLALVALQKRWRAAAVTLGVVSALFSPLAAAFLAMVCLAWAAYGSIRRRWIIATALVCMSVIVTLGMLFPGTGPFPFPWTGLVPTELLCLTALTPLVRTTPAVRLGALLYAAASLFSFLVPNPLGGNAPRLAASIGVPLLACFLTAPGPALGRLSSPRLLRWVARGREILLPSRWRYAAVLIVVPFAVWQWAPWDGVIKSPSGAPHTQARFYQPVIAELARVAPTPVRLEIPPTLDHWEAAFVAPHVALARGWERQLDIADNPLFYNPGELTPAAYYAWLRAEGVTYVALPAAPLDYAAKAEGALLRSGLVTDLDLVWSTPQWQLWKVAGSPGLVSGPGTLTSLEPDHLTLQASEPGVLTVRVRYTKFWSVTSGTACIGPSPVSTGTDKAPPYQWTQIDALAPGVIQLSASVLHPAQPPFCPSS